MEQALAAQLRLKLGHGDWFGAQSPSTMRLATQSQPVGMDVYLFLFDG
jgi:hypothetical protein